MRKFPNFFDFLLICPLWFRCIHITFCFDANRLYFVSFISVLWSNPNYVFFVSLAFIWPIAQFVLPYPPDLKTLFLFFNSLRIYDRDHSYHAFSDSCSTVAQFDPVPTVLLCNSLHTLCVLVLKTLFLFFGSSGVFDPNRFVFSSRVFVLVALDQPVNSSAIAQFDPQSYFILAT